MTKKERKLHATAHHEAGHAVAAWRHGLKFKHVTIIPGEGNLGHLLHGRWPKWFDPESGNDDRSRLYAQRRIEVSFAGQIAEARFRHRRPHFGMYGDNKNAVDMALTFVGSIETCNAYLDYCFLNSRDLLSLA